MKHLFTLLALTIGFSMNAQWVSGTATNAIQTATNTASGESSTAMGYDTRASGYASTAMGRGTIASNFYSTAMGNYTKANADASTAMGWSTTASGKSSTAMGFSTEAIGVNSTAMGYYTTASDFGSLVIGQFNDAGSSETTIGVSAGTFSLANTAFVIGNGTGTGVDASDAFKVMFNGDTSASGSVTATEFIGNGSQLTNLPFSLNDTSGNGIQSNNNTARGANSIAMGNDTTASGYASTAMGVSTKAEGVFSTAMGVYTTASGDASTAMGKSTEASGDNSTAMGDSTKAEGVVSTAMGRNTTASDYGSLVIGQYNDAGSAATSDTSFSLENTAFVIGRGANADARLDAFKVMFNGDTSASGSVTATEFIGNGSQLTNLPFSLNDTSGNGIQSNNNTARGANSIAMGNDTTASGYASTAMGVSTKAEGVFSTAMGVYTTASGDASTAMGKSTEASGDFSTAMGDSTKAEGVVSTAMGRNTTASDYGSLVIGQYNLAGLTETTDGASADSFDTANTAFVIGNGTVDVAKDAFKVMFNGDTTVSNDLTVNGNVMVSSDARLKANIVSLGATLAKLLLIDGKSYTMKKDGKQKIGVLAQDIQKVFPELVSTDDRDMLAVNYQGLVPVLINALKEQDAKMKEQGAKMIEQDSKLKEQEKRLERLEAIISKMDK